MEFRKHPERTGQFILSAPIIYAMIVPLVFADLCLEFYHRLCFPLYGIPLVNRGKYIRIDRHKLSYLTPLEKFNCVYCGYANGFLNYATNIAGDTEKYWCAIKHEQRDGFHNPEHHKSFVEYNDKKTFEKKFQAK
ncbi:MAG: hypothetical protein H6502_02605 [Candidatus Woesearchaeota archaeon]|nr:MAG: hypothetical protein H6502_02605 [Candidatus Woesearchaeota archaeon]